MKQWRQTVIPHQLSAVTLGSISYFMRVNQFKTSIFHQSLERSPLLQLLVRVPWRMEEVDGWLMGSLGELKAIYGQDDWILLAGSVPLKECRWRAKRLLCDASGGVGVKRTNSIKACWSSERYIGDVLEWVELAMEAWKTDTNTQQIAITVPRWGLQIACFDQPTAQNSNSIFSIVYTKYILALMT